MSSQEELIKYYDEQAWKEYFEKDLGELYSTIRGFLDLRDTLEDKLSGRPVSEVIAESEEYKKMLFGGVKVEDGPYEERAMAKFYSEVIGIEVTNLDVIRGNLREGVAFDKAVSESEVNFKETDFIKLVKEVEEELDDIYAELEGIIQKPSPKSYDSNKAMAGPEAVRDILNAAKRLLPHYNPLSQFIISTFSIPRPYALKQYPNLFDESVQSTLRKFGIILGEEPLLEPDIEDEELKKEWALIGLETGTVGHRLRNLIMHKLFAMFSGNLLEVLQSYLKGVEYEFKKFVDNRLEVLRKRMEKVTEEFKNVRSDLFFVSENYRMFNEYCRYVANLTNLSGGKIILRSYGRHGSYVREFSYTKLLSYLAPAMFLGVAWLRPNETPPVVFFEW